MLRDEVLGREELKKRVEPFIYSKLKESKYTVRQQVAHELLTWDRLDLAFKLFYLDNIDLCSTLAKRVYHDDIRSQTLGAFVEFGNENEKNCFESYIEHFSFTYASIEKYGFLKERSLIPLSCDGGILNGAHRVASAIRLNMVVSTIQTEKVPMVADYRYFLDRDVCVSHMDLIVQKFIQYSKDNVYIAFLWPSGVGHKNEVESMFSQIIYKKEMKLTSTGAFNLLVELYKHMDWAGSCENSFSGVKKKLLECFPELTPFQVILFQSESIGAVRKLKEKVRSVYDIGFSSVHITDTQEEAMRVSQLICNENGLHFLNNASPYKFMRTYMQLDKFKLFLSENNIAFNDVVIDGSSTLSLYGFRESVDVDFLALNFPEATCASKCFEAHDSELEYHHKTKLELIYDSSNYFWFYGLKFIGFAQLYLMKVNRDEEKDRNDCQLMKASIDGFSHRKVLAKFRQRIFYTKLRLNYFFAKKIKSSLEMVGLYDIVRTAFRKITNRQ